MQIRTDLAIEKREMLGNADINGVEVNEKQYGDVKITEIHVTSAEGESRIGKPMGRYFTLETGSFPECTPVNDERLFAISAVLNELLPEKGAVLIAGLGNPDITPDALGTGCASQIFATRHLSDEIKQELNLPELREVSAITPGVTGQTGLEAQEIIAGVCRKINPCAVITVDALAAGSVTRLANTVQVSNTGISPGSGVRNSRRTINYKNLGVPVIAVGVPTVVDALSLAGDISNTPPKKDCEEKYAGMMVTPGNIDTVIRSASRLLALSINCSLQKNLTPESLLSLM